MIKSNKKSLVVLILSCLFVLCIGLSFTMRNASATTVVAPVMQDGAEIRAYNEDGKSGVRFTAFVDDSHFTDGVLNDGTIAGIIITKGEVEASALTHASGEAGGAYAGKVLDVRADRWDASRNIAGAKAFNAVVYNIPVSAYGSDLTARAYVGIYNDSQEKYEYTYSENACTRSPAELASKALAAGGDDEMLYNYVNGVNTEFTVNESTEEAVELSLAVGQTIKLQPATKDLAIALTTDSALVELGNNQITVVGYNADNTQAVITAKLGSTTKNITVTVKDEFKDENLATNLLADFDEKYYAGYGVKQGPAVSHTYMRIESVSAEAAKEKLGVDSGVIAIRQYGNYDMAVISFDTVKVADVAGIYIKMYAEGTAFASANCWLTINGKELRLTGLSSKNQGKTITANSWNYLYISKADLALFNNPTEISQISFYFYGSAGNYYYLDEMGVNVTETSNELLNINSEKDVAINNFPWGLTVSYLSATDSACPTGATGGVAKVTGASGNGTIFYFKQNPDKASVSKIIIRAYIPAGQTQIRIFSVSTAGAYGSSVYLTGQGGQFYDYELDISSWDAADLGGLRFHGNFNPYEILIDSITYIAK